jgi:hypothetical protein
MHNSNPDAFLRSSLKSGVLNRVSHIAVESPLKCHWYVTLFHPVHLQISPQLASPMWWSTCPVRYLPPFPHLTWNHPFVKWAHIKSSWTPSGVLSKKCLSQCGPQCLALSRVPSLRDLNVVFTLLNFWHKGWGIMTRFFTNKSSHTYLMAPGKKATSIAPSSLKFAHILLDSNWVNSSHESEL